MKKSNFSEFEKNTNDELKKTKEKSHFDSCINQIRNLELSEEIKNILKGIGAKEKENKEKALNKCKLKRWLSLSSVTVFCA